MNTCYGKMVCSRESADAVWAVVSCSHFLDM